MWGQGSCRWVSALGGELRCWPDRQGDTKGGLSADPASIDQVVEVDVLWEVGCLEPNLHLIRPRIARPIVEAAIGVPTAPCFISIVACDGMVGHGGTFDWLPSQVDAAQMIEVIAWVDIECCSLTHAVDASLSGGQSPVRGVCGPSSLEECAV